MATHSSVLAWRIPGTAEPGGLPSMGSHRVRHDWSDLAAAATPISGEGDGTPLQYSCLENPMDRGTWWAAVHGVSKSQTQLSDFTFTFMHWRRKWQPTPVLLPGESYGQRSLVGYSLWDHKELDTTEHAFIHDGMPTTCQVYVGTGSMETNKKCLCPQNVQWGRQ